MSLNTKQSYRVMFRFWLDDNRPEEKELIQEIKSLKKNRSFAATIRDGIRLMRDLRQGKTDVLRELFPWVIEEKNAPPPLQIEDILSAFQQSQQASLALPSPQKRALTAPKPQPNLDDLVIKKATSNENTFFNLQLSAYGLGTIRLDELPREVIEYGVERGKLPKDILKKLPIQNHQNNKTDRTNPSLEPQIEPKKGPKAMDVPTVAAPSFDDLDDIALDF